MKIKRNILVSSVFMAAFFFIFNYLAYDFLLTMLSGDVSLHMPAEVMGLMIFGSLVFFIFSYIVFDEVSKYSK